LVGFGTLDFDGATRAAEALKDSLDLKVRKFNSKDNAVDESLSETVRQVLHSLNRVGTGLESAEEDFASVGQGVPKYIHGVEFHM
jgi:hypothetical protein